ncbi:phage tail tip lysozyme [Achromobacter mucicolens]|uniref:phage tail tip lysozyme n=1 Tax=Achromobacter mucicolens TaxID=1389922 RepID=UPI002FDF0EDD
MATVLDALVVTLTMNAKGFKQGAAEVDDSLTHTREESAKTAREMEARGKQAAMFFSKVRNEALALLAVFTAGMGLKNFVSSTVESTASLARMSDNLNMSAKDLAEWQLAAKNAGGSVEGITAQLRESADQVAKFKRGMAAETLPAFFQFGGKTEDLKDGNTYLQARARIVAEIYKTDRARAALAANMMGLDAQQFNLYKEGPEGIARRRREQSGPAAEQAAAAQRAEQLRQKYDTAMNKLSSVGVNVLTSMMPAFDFLVEKLIELGDWIITNKAQINEGVKLLVMGFEQILKAITEVANKLIPEETRKKIAESKDPVLASMLAAKEAITPSWMAKGKADLTPDASDAIAKFEKMGWSRAQAIGIVNNLQAESGGKLDHRAVGDNGTAFGVAQWRNERVDMFKQVMGVALAQSTRDQQYAFVDWELRNSHKAAGDKLRAAKTVEDASRVVTTDFEIPAQKEKKAEERAAVATELAKLAQAEALKTGALASVGAAQAAQPTAQSVNNTTSTTTNSSETHISGPITVVTTATDGAGIARDLAGMGRNQNLVQQGNTGLF